MNLLFRLALWFAFLTIPLLPALAAENAAPNFLKIGTGSVSGTYFVMGGLLANVLSRPPGSRPCAVGGSCGVENLIVVTQATEGSGENLKRLKAGSLDIALAQGDSVHFAFHGIGDYQNIAFADLRAIGHLYYDTVHIVVRGDSGITELSELAGRRVVIGDDQSGTSASARLILSAYGLLNRIKPVSMKPSEAADALADSTIDAFFFVGGQPVPFIDALAEQLPLRLLPISGREVAKLKQQYPFFSASTLPKGLYGATEPIPTLNVSAQLVTTNRLPYPLVHALTQALWHPTNLAIIQQGHSQGREMAAAKAFNPLSITLHAGAERVYRDRNLIPQPPAPWTTDDASPPTP